VLTKNVGPHPKKIVRKSRNSCWVNSGGVGAHGQLTRSSNGLSPETNTNAQRILVLSRLLRSHWYPLLLNCWSFPHSFWQGIPVPSPGLSCVFRIFVVFEKTKLGTLGLVETSKNSNKWARNDRFNWVSQVWWQNTEQIGIKFVQNSFVRKLSTT